MPSLLALYSRLGIKVFTLFDGDKGSGDPKTDFNEALLKMSDGTPEPSPETTIYKSGAVWDTTFADAVREGFGGEAWDKAFAEAGEEFSIPADQAGKKFAVVWRAIEGLLSQKLRSKPLESLWQAITSFFGIAPTPPQ